MRALRTFSWVVVALTLAGAASASAADWVALDAGAAVLATGTAPPPALGVQHSDLASLRVSTQVAGLEFRRVENKLGPFVELLWPEGSQTDVVGAPAVPVFRRLFIAPAGAEVTWRVDAGMPVSIDTRALGLPSWVLPAQAPIEKVPGARENAPFAFDAAAYRTNADYPGELVHVEELGLVRDQRLCLLEIRPVACNAVSGMLTIYPCVTVELDFGGAVVLRDARPPLPRLHNAVLNPEVLPPTPRGSGDYLVIVASDYQAAIAPFVAAKQAQGFTVSTWVPPSASNTVIKQYIQTLWNGGTTLDYILLVGDTNTIPQWTGGGEGSPPTDIQYACMGGASDWYPDIALGRFPCRNTTQLQNMLDKTLLFENGPLPDPEYVKRAVFMASEDNYSVSEGTHNWVISNYMIPNEIVCDKLYCHTYNATTQQVRNAFNAGRFFGIYSGHGADTYWADGPYFSQADVNGLTNVGMYPFVCSFACVTGNFPIDECFMETWVRVANKGAVTAWGSSVNSYWTEDDVLEKRLFDSIYDEDDAVYADAGSVINDAKLRYLAQMGSGSTTRRYFEMYNLMGDPALPFPGNCSDAGTVQLDGAKYACEDGVSIRVVDCGLNVNPNVVDTVVVTITSGAEPAGELVTLTETNANSATFDGNIGISETNAAGVLLVAPGDLLTITYLDADDGLGGIDVPVVVTAVVDCTGPMIAGVQAINIEPRGATVTFTANEPVRGIVHYGLACNALNQLASGSGYAMTANITLTALQDNTTYYFSVDAEDEAGNLTVDPTCYSFTTPEVPDFFTQLFTTDNDLDNISLIFTPNGSVDFYDGCNESITALPTNPTGGTGISLTDDSYSTINLPAGVTVSLYGVSYTKFYVGSNGFITFTSGDTTTGESLAEHFEQPRISALFDDLNPGAGGVVSWKQLADRIAVTWLNVPEYNVTNQNTFQIEMFFDGTIKIHYLAVAVTDGLAGLSDGGGVDPDFLMSDLSAMGPCLPTPPQANNVNATTGLATPVGITLNAHDDGLPNPPGILDYVITALPAHGTLKDAADALVTAVPYVLPNHTKTLTYTPSAIFVGTDVFTYVANDGGTAPEGGDSNTATVSVLVEIEPQVVYSWPLDTNPGWATEGQWAFGQPLGGGSHARDPLAGHTGTNVYGYNLAGDYTNSMPRYCLTTAAIDCSGVSGVELRFWRWLGIEAGSYDHAGIEVSPDGTTWVSIWEHAGNYVNESAWTQKIYSLAGVADNQPVVYIRWAIGATDGGVTYHGWNIDDIEIWGMVAPSYPVGDLDCSGAVGFGDINPFILALTNPSAYEVAFPLCDAGLADVDGSGACDFGDINPFIQLLTSN